MIKKTEEQPEMEEQAATLKWQNDSRCFKRFLKFRSPQTWDELQSAKYFAENYQPTDGVKQNLANVIAISFIQEMDYSKWQTEVIVNAKKLLSPMQKNFLARWNKDKIQFLKYKGRLPGDKKLTPLGLARLYGLLDVTREDGFWAGSLNLSSKTLFNSIDSLPFFGLEAENGWTPKAKKDFQSVLIHHLGQGLKKGQKEIPPSFFLSQNLTRAALQDENLMRSLFKIEVLGAVANDLDIRLDKKISEHLVKNLKKNNQQEKARHVVRVFHLEEDGPVFLQRNWWHSLFKKAGR